MPPPAISVCLYWPYKLLIRLLTSFCPNTVKDSRSSRYINRLLNILLFWLHIRISSCIILMSVNIENQLFVFIVLLWAIWSFKTPPKSAQGKNISGISREMHNNLLITTNVLNLSVLWLVLVHTRTLYIIFNFKNIVYL